MLYASSCIIGGLALPSGAASGSFHTPRTQVLASAPKPKPQSKTRATWVSGSGQTCHYTGNTKASKSPHCRAGGSRDSCTGASFGFTVRGWVLAVSVPSLGLSGPFEQSRASAVIIGVGLLHFRAQGCWVWGISGVLWVYHSAFKVLVLAMSDAPPEPYDVATKVCRRASNGPGIRLAFTQSSWAHSRLYVLGCNVRSCA